MSVELVTGYFGVDSSGKPKRHVSSAEDGALQAGTVGLGCYALSTGSTLSATMEDANTLVVADGDVVMNGRHVSLPDPTSFTIPTGVQGQKVSNLAVLRYEKAADSVESVTPLVLTGEPSAGTPTDPACNEGSILDGDSPVDMPLYRVVTDGINAEDPVPLFDVLTSMAELRDLVSQTEGELSALSDAAPYVRAQSASSRVFCGSSVVTFPQGGKTTDLWTYTQFRSRFGVSDPQACCVIVANGDYSSNAEMQLTAEYRPGAAWSVIANRAGYMLARINWVVVTP